MGHDLKHAFIGEGDKWPTVPATATQFVFSREKEVGLDVYWLEADDEEHVPPPD